jgi:CHAT domain-containing protein/tetratricopeptide (TPR) repeat protein
MLVLRSRARRSAVVLCFTLLSAAAYCQPAPTPLWKVFYDSANHYLNTDIKRSLLLFSKSEQIARNDLGIYDENYLVILNGLGLAHEHAKDFNQARRYLSENASLSREIYPAEDPRLLQSLYNLGIVFRKGGDTEQATKVFGDIMDISRRTNQRNFYLLSATALVNILESRHRLDSALALGRSVMASQMAKEYESISFELQIAEGRILRKLKLYEESVKVLTSVSKQLMARGSAFRELTRAVNIQLSLLDTDTGLYGKAEKDLLQLYRSVKNDKLAGAGLIAEVTNALAFVYEKLDVYDKSIAYYQEALSYCTEGAGDNLRACDAIQNNIAGIYLRQRQFEKAIAGYRSYVDSRHDEGRFGDPDFLTAQNNLAISLRQVGSYDEALAYFKQVQNYLEKGGNHNDDFSATILNNIAVTETMMGRYADATENFKTALKIKQQLYGTESPLLLDLYGNLGVSLWASGKRNESLPHFDKSLQLGLREVRYNFQNLTETEQVQFYARQKENFERFNTLAVQSAGDMPEMLVQMFNNQVLLKSLTFFTNRKTTRLAKEANDPQLRKVIELKLTKSTQLGHYYQTTLAELTAKGVSLTKLEHEIDSLDKIIRHRLSNDDTDEDPSWNHIQKKLTSDEASVDIIRFRKYDILPDKSSNSGHVRTGFTDSIYYAALITKAETKENPELVLLKNGRELESRFFYYYKNTVKFDFEDTISIQQYWAPIEKSLASKKSLHVSPDGVYRQININTLRDRKGNYNIEKYDIHFSLNPASLVSSATAEPVDFSKLVLMGDPLFGIQQAQVAVNSVQSSYTSLSGTQHEISEIAKLVKSSSPPVRYVRAEASEQNLRKIKSPGVLHIATHGFFSIDVSYLNEQVKSDYLFHSGLLLSAGKSETYPAANDGIVTAYDILNLDLSGTDLVVLSACETGLGKNEYGEGIHGLQRSFMQAGARDVVISLWRVDDRATKDLMVKFYQYMQQKKSASQALRLAQIDIMKKEPLRRLWGSFITVGSN